ncbi:MAG: hypothetical protein ACOCUT_00960 [bacterium]
MTKPLSIEELEQLERPSLVEIINMEILKRKQDKITETIVIPVDDLKLSDREKEFILEAYSEFQPKIQLGGLPYDEDREVLKLQLKGKEYSFSLNNSELHAIAPLSIDALVSTTNLTENFVRSILSINIGLVESYQKKEAEYLYCGELYNPLSENELHTIEKLYSSFNPKVEIGAQQPDDQPFYIEFTLPTSK